MILPAKFLLQIVAVVVLGCAVGWCLSRFAGGNKKTIEIGDGSYVFDSSLNTILPAEAKLNEGQRLALVVGISKSSQPPEYLGVLQRKYQNQGLKVLVVLSPDSTKALALLTKAIGVASVTDSDGRFQRLLKFVSTHQHDAVLIYDENYKVKFHFLGMPDSDLLRQLVEKYLVGRITYKPSELLASSLVGRRVQGLQCDTDRPPARTVFVVFPPGCSSCELNSYREALNRARENSLRSNGPDEKWALVFINGRDAHVVAEAQNLGFSRRDVCAVREDILLDPYQTRKSATTVPLLLRTDENGMVTEVRDLRVLSSGGAQ
jgi:hypothetical protein